jgi:hypothetical protein
MKFNIIYLILLITGFPSFLFSQLPYPNKLDAGAGSFEKFYALNINRDTIIDVVYNRSLYAGGKGFYMGLGQFKDGHLVFNTFKLSDEYIPNAIVMDYNHDGVDDVLATCRSSENYIPTLWISDGNMLVRSSLDSSIFADTCFQTFNFFDINGDGFDDFYISKISGVNEKSFEIYIANPTDLGSYTLTYQIGAHKIIQAIDVNNDGYVDFIGNEFDPKKMFLWFYDIGTNMYKKQPIIYDFTGSKSITFVGDIDYDGVMDIVIDDSNKDSLYLLPRFMEDSIQTITPLISITFGGYYWKDINLDGFIDFTINGTKNFLNDGSGNLTLSNIKMAPSGESIYQKYDPINKTGFDLMQNGSAWQYIDGVWLNDLATTSEYKLQSVDDVEVLDLDQDGNTDFVMATRWGAAIIAYYRDAYGHYTKKQKIAVTEGAHDVSFSDLNQDGIIDMVYSGIWSGDLNIKYGIEPGVFSERVNVLKSYGLVRGSAIGDFSNDSFPDIIVSSITSGQILLFENIDGIIQPMKVIYDNNDGPTSLHIEDYNEDGYMDIIYTSGGSYKVLENDKNGGWLTAKKLFENNAKEFIRADFDGDRKNEWVVSNWQEVFIYKIENGVPTIWRTIDVEDVSYRTDFYVMDYNGDGYKDIIYLVGGNPKARLYINNENQNWIYDDLFENKMSYKLPTFKEESFNLDIDNDYDIDLGYVFNEELFLIQDRINDPGLTGVTFWDKNLDSIYQSSEDIKLTGVGITAQSENYTISRYSNNGIYKHYLPQDTFDVSGIPLSDCWIGQQSTVSLDLTNPDSLVRHDFGFELQDGSNEEIKVSMSRSTLRCLFPIQHYITIKNNTCFPIVGSLNHIQDRRMDIPYLISLDYAEYEKPVISLPNLTLQPGEVLKYNFISKAPDESNVDSFISDTLRIYYKDPLDDNVTVIKDFVFSERLRCAYDPNDKLVQPDRSNEFGKSYITNESMYYTIRFQNTGNDTAFNIKLIDTLSPYLDLSTFDPIDASHTYEVSLDIKERILKVDFRDILLPDSTTNLSGSNGFFTFGIRPHAGLKDDDKVENNAAIYFDFNKPIFTNTVQNVFIKDLQSLYVNTHEIDKVNTFSVYPNPINDVVYIHSNHHDNHLNHIQLFDIVGREILKQNMRSEETTILDMSALMPGCYILHISDHGSKTKYLSTKIIKTN